MKHISILLAFVVVVSSAQVPLSFDDQAVDYARRVTASQKAVVPKSGYVPDSGTAVAIATAVLAPIYGKSIAASEKPWHAGLKGGVWTVVGTFNGKGNGGEGIVQIDKKTGAIIFVTHTM
jgi:hypothetical protein